MLNDYLRSAKRHIEDAKGADSQADFVAAQQATQLQLQAERQLSELKAEMMELGQQKTQVLLVCHGSRCLTLPPAPYPAPAPAVLITAARGSLKLCDAECHTGAADAQRRECSRAEWCCQGLRTQEEEQRQEEEQGDAQAWMYRLCSWRRS